MALRAATETALKTTQPTSEGRTSPSPTSPTSNNASEAAVAFDSFPDYSKLNEGRTNATKTDTFSTPSTLNKKYQTPTRHDRRWGLGDTKELEDICATGFQKVIKGYGRDLMLEVQSAITTGVESIRTEMQDTQRTLADSNETRFNKIQEILAQIQGQQKQPQSCDFAPLMHDLNAMEQLRDASHQSLVQLVEGALSSGIGKVLEEARELRDAQESMFAELRGTHMKQLEGTLELAQRAEGQMDDMLAIQRQVQQDIVNFQKVSASHYDNFDSIIDTQLTNHNREDVVQVDFSKVVSCIEKVHTNVNFFGSALHQEIGKIQQAVNVDFAKLCHSLEEKTTTLEIITDQMAASAESSVVPFEGGQSNGPSPSPSPLPLAIPDFGTAQPIDVMPNALVPVDQQALTTQVVQQPSVTKRLRNMYQQTNVVNHNDVGCQTNESRMDQGKKKFALKTLPVPVEPTKETKAQKAAEGRQKASAAVFATADNIKQNMRKNLAKKPYNVHDFYWDVGVWQYIARNSVFETVSFYIIAINTVWIAIDTDFNDATVLLEAHPVFMVAENLFTFYFFFEIFARFMAFKRKLNCFKDAWFVFDAFLVLLMVAETWIVTIIVYSMGSGGARVFGNASIIRTVRIARLIRISRLMRFMKSVPELMIIIKGIGYASRSVMVFLCLWLLIIFIFAVVFRQIIDLAGMPSATKFGTVGQTMNTLFVQGVLAGNGGDIIDDLTDITMFFWPLIVFFVMLASVMLMYMLVGVLVDIVTMIAQAEKEGMIVLNLLTNLRRAFADLNKNTEDGISKKEFVDLLTEPSVLSVIQDNGVDVVVLVDMCDVIFEDVESQILTAEEAASNDGKQRTLSFDNLVNVILDLRGSNPATVKDSMETRRILKGIVNDSMSHLEKSVHAQFEQMQNNMLSLREAELRYEEGDLEGDSD